MIVIDTSAWVEYLQDTGSTHHRAVRELGVTGDFAVPDVVRLELLAGARDESSAVAIARMLARGTAAGGSLLDHDLAAELYRRARANGRTVRSLIDCVIAATCLRLDLPLLARDRDFAALAAVSDLSMQPV